MTTHPARRFGRVARRAQKRLARRQRDLDLLMKDRYFHANEGAFHRPGSLKGGY